jgi:hypothetical protein
MKMKEVIVRLVILVSQISTVLFILSINIPVDDQKPVWVVFLTEIGQGSTAGILIVYTERLFKEYFL